MLAPIRETVFSQTMISTISGGSKSTITRLIKDMKLNHINQETAKTKKYDLESAQKIISSVLGKKIIKDKIHVFYNLKGGTGKTTVSFQLSSLLNISGKRVLMIDCDSQGHLSTMLRFPEDGDYHTLYDVLINDIPVKMAIQNIAPGLDAIPSNLSLSRVEVPLSQKARREDKLLNKLEEVADDYDYIIIDTNPSISTLNQNALIAADCVNLVCETAPFSLYGLRILKDEVKKLFMEVKKHSNFRIVCNRYESKTTTAQEVLGYIRSHYKDTVYDSIIRKSEDFNIATKEKTPITSFCKSKSSALEDIVEFFHEFLEESCKEKKPDKSENQKLFA